MEIWGCAPTSPSSTSPAVIISGSSGYATEAQSATSRLRCRARLAGSVGSAILGRHHLLLSSRMGRRLRSSGAKSRKRAGIHQESRARLIRKQRNESGLLSKLESHTPSRLLCGKTGSSCATSVQSRTIRKCSAHTLNHGASLFASEQLRIVGTIRC